MQASQTSLAMIEIIKELNSGNHDIQKIYTEVSNRLGLPRPTVRRAKKLLLEQLKIKIAILEPELKKPKGVEPIVS